MIKFQQGEKTIFITMGHWADSDTCLRESMEKVEGVLHIKLSVTGRATVLSPTLVGPKIQLSMYRSDTWMVPEAE